MLGLGLVEIRRSKKAEFLPAIGALWLVPTCASRRANEHTLEFADHGMSIGLGDGGRFSHIGLPGIC
jgi:hypothetical protein